MQEWGFVAPPEDAACVRYYIGFECDKEGPQPPDRRRVAEIAEELMGPEVFEGRYLIRRGSSLHLLRGGPFVAAVRVSLDDRDPEAPFLIASFVTRIGALLMTWEDTEPISPVGWSVADHLAKRASAYGRSSEFGS